MHRRLQSSIILGMLLSLSVSAQADPKRRAPAPTPPPVEQYLTPQERQCRLYGEAAATIVTWRREGKPLTFTLANIRHWMATQTTLSLVIREQISQLLTALAHVVYQADPTAITPARMQQEFETGCLNPTATPTPEASRRLW